MPKERLICDLMQAVFLPPTGFKVNPDRLLIILKQNEYDVGWINLLQDTEQLLDIVNNVMHREFLD
jgi:hypothetical protein